MIQNTNRTHDFIVIGGGIAGTSITWELSASEHGVVLEREEAFGYHTTGRSAATSVELLQNQTTHTLTRASRDFMKNPPEGFTESPLLKPSGCIITANAAEQTGLETAYEEARALGVEAMLVSSSEVARHIPVIKESPDAIHAGIYEPGAQRIDVDALLQGYIKGAKSRGCEFYRGIEIDAIRRQHDMWHIKAGDKTFTAPIVINAAGAWADEIANMAGLAPMGLQPKRRTIVTFSAPDQYDVSKWPMIGDIGGTFYFLPEAGHLMGSSADKTPSPPCDSQPEELDIATAVYNIEQHTHLKIDKIHHKWAGLRTFAPDELPIVGYDSKAEGFFWFAGQGGFGIQVAPALARIGAALALDSGFQSMAATLNLDLNKILPGRLR